MIANIVSAEYDNATGAVNVVMNNTTVNGYSNTVLSYQTANTLSVPLEGNLVNLDIQAPTQLQMVGVNSRITDIEYTIAPGEFTSYSTGWYLSTRNAGIEAQEANTPNKENLMAGQSTNAVLNDMLNIIIEIITYLGTHTHSAVQTGTDVSGTVVVPPPVDTEIIADQTYISANHNLLITGTYEPK